MSSDMNRLLGKKREVRSDDEEEREQKERVPMKRVRTADGEEQHKQQQRRTSNDNDNDSDSQSDHKPVKSLFGASDTGFKVGIFGDLSNPSTQPKSLFGDLTQQKSLFGSSDKPTLFSSNEVNIFTKGNSIFDFSNCGGEKKDNNNNDNDGEDGDDDDDKIGKSNSPNPYNPFKDDVDANSLFKKIYVKEVEFYLYDKESKTYKSKGEGFVSIETYEVESKQNALILLRNKVGNLIFQGILNEKFNKFASYVKKFKHVANFYFLVQVGEKAEDKKLELSSAKIPFLSQEELKEFEEKYNEAIALIKGEKKEK